MRPLPHSKTETYTDSPEGSLTARRRSSAVTASWPSAEFVPLGPMDFYKVKLNDGETLPDELLEVISCVYDDVTLFDRYG